MAKCKLLWLTYSFCLLRTPEIQALICKHCKLYTICEKFVISAVDHHVMVMLTAVVGKTIERVMSCKNV